MNKGHAQKKWIFSARIPVTVVVHFYVGLLQIPQKHFTGVCVNNIIGEFKRLVLLYPGKLQLPLQVKGKNIVSDEVLFSIVLMKT